MMRTRETQQLGRWIAIAALLLFWWGAIHTLNTTSATYDEPEYLARGYTYLATGDTSLKLRHPILIDAVASWPLFLLPELSVPDDKLASAAGNFHVYAAQFMWEHNGEYIKTIFYLARLPIVAFALIMISAVFAWSSRLFGVWGGVTAVLVAILDPNLLAHGRLVTPDVGQSTFIFVATFLFWCYCTKRRGGLLLATGFVLGVAQTAGYPALILYPLWVVMGFVLDWQKQDASETWLKRGWEIVADWFFPYLQIVLVSAVTIWAIYGFTWGMIDTLGISGPAPYYWEEFFDLLNRLGRQDISYLNGEVYRGGRSFFFVVALFIKTPISLLILTVASTAVLLWKKRFMRHIFVWLIPIFYYVVALNSSLNIGYRHLFPILPFLYVYAGSVVSGELKNRQSVQVALGGLLLWMAWATWQIYPYPLTYFNEVVGGPENGLNYLVVSDLDWGQDLIGLEQYMTENSVDEVFLSYFGTAAPERYGIPHQDLPAWPPRGIPGRLPYHPTYPLPGTYAISAANLIGAQFEETPDIFAYFQQRRPTAVIGNSIYVYDVAPWGDQPPTAWVSYGRSLADVTDADIQDEFGTNQLIPHWVDGQNGLMFANGRMVLQTSDDVVFAHELRQLLSEEAQTALDQEGFAIFADGLSAMNSGLQNGIDADAFGAQDQCGLERSATANDSEQRDSDFNLAYVGWLDASSSKLASEPYTGLSFWRVTGAIPASPVIFVHILDPNGNIIAQSDRFDVSHEQLREGDIVVQLHRFDLPREVILDCHVALGLYRRDTFGRANFELGNGVQADRFFVPGKSSAP